MKGDWFDLISGEGWKRLSNHLGLTPRQVEIATLICRALRNRQIADQLDITTDTVHVHVKDLFRKIGVDSRVGVVVELVRLDRELDRAPRLEREPYREDATCRGFRQAPVTTGV